MEEDQLVQDEQYVLDGKGLRGKLLDIVSEQEEYVKKVRYSIKGFKQHLDNTMSLCTQSKYGSRTADGRVQRKHRQDCRINETTKFNA
jgi:hypothetical protein